MATSCLIPVSNSLFRICMGWVSSASRPGMFFSVSDIIAMSWSVVFAEVHSAFGFSATMMSARSTGIGSVGISALPIRLTTCFTSGYLAFRSCSALLQLSTICESDVPCAILISMAKSPSSRLGMNSPPKNLKPTPLTQNSATAMVMTSLRRCSVHSNIGRYHSCSLASILSETVSWVCTFLLRNVQLAIGT